MPADNPYSINARLHLYSPPNLTLLEHLPLASGDTQLTSIPAPSNVLLFVGGLYDSPLGTLYVHDLASLFPITTSKKQPWRVMQVTLSSAGRQWGIGSIDRDIEEIALAISFIRTDLFHDEDIRIVLMGHSTGCQDVMHYITAPNPNTLLDSSRKGRVRLHIQGAILQAPVSDRDAVRNENMTKPALKQNYNKVLQMCKDTSPEKWRDTMIDMELTRPSFGPTPISLSRWWSLTSPESPEKPSSEDFFSFDLLPSRHDETFGVIATRNVLRGNMDTKPRLLVLMSELDESVPDWVNKRQLLSMWEAALEKGDSLSAETSGIIPNAVHDVGGDDADSSRARLIDLRSRILKYLDQVRSMDYQDSWTIISQDKKALSQRSSPESVVDLDERPVKPEPQNL